MKKLSLAIIISVTIMIVVFVCLLFIFPIKVTNLLSSVQNHNPENDLRYNPPHERVQISKFTLHLFKNQTEAYYINLDRSIGRRENMEKKLREQQLSATRQPAVNGRALNLNDHADFVKNIRTHFEKVPSRLGHLGCFLSHLAVYQRFLSESSRDYCLIMEDDCTFYGVNFKAEIADAMQYVPTDWDILLCGYHIDEDWDPRHKLHNSGVRLHNRVLHNIQYFTGLHCYFVRRATVQRLLVLLSQPKWYIDWEISRHAAAGRLKVYGIFPPVVCQPGSFHVNIGNINYKYNCPCTTDMLSLTNNY